jgi:AcrR family transcriptional regulator
MSGRLASGARTAQPDDALTRRVVSMGTRERQERERRAVARAILDSARELFVAEGYQHVSIRRVAERIEYSPAAIYRYFSSKDDICLALAEEGFRLLADMTLPRAGAADPLEAVRGAFWGYYEFSKTHPEYFALMFLDRSVPRISRDWERFGFVRDLRSTLSRRLRECMEAGALPPGTNPEAAFSILATAIHGASVIRLCSRLTPGEDADALARDTLEAAIAGLRAESPITFAPAARCPVVHENGVAPHDPAAAPAHPDPTGQSGPTGPSSISRGVS